MTSSLDSGPPAALNESALSIPSREEALAVLSPFEQRAFSIAERMNRGAWKEVWVFFQRQVGARWVGLIAEPQLEVFGFEHVTRTTAERPLLLVANHRSVFDLIVVSEVLFRRLDRPIRINFPIRGRGYYQTVTGVLANGLVGFWCMFPPLFALPTHQAYDRYALHLLIELCREGRGNVIGIHPEGGRNRDPDPYSFRKLQPGTGRIIHAARPQVLPVFIAGLGNSLARQVSNLWQRREPIRVHFGPEPDLSPFYTQPAKGSTYKAITEFVMDRVRELAEQDRARYGKTTSGG
ncbi:MAG TPA: lysophospholipid acyltransferase family protein [Gemmatimonadaceae bacterium]